jgi:hypothetical protein
MVLGRQLQNPARRFKRSSLSWTSKVQRTVLKSVDSLSANSGCSTQLLASGWVRFLSCAPGPTWRVSDVRASEGVLSLSNAAGGKSGYRVCPDSFLAASPALEASKLLNPGP